MDAFHTHSGTLYYPHVWLFMMDWWVPLLFGVAGVAVGMSHLDLDQRLGKAYPELTWVHVAFGMGSFAVIYFISGFLNIDDTRKTVLLCTLAFLVWYIYDKTYSGFLLALVTAAIGTFVEISLIRSHWFFYTNPDFFGVPYWLPALYVAASVAVGNFARKLNCAIL
jgi:hypothetical protein